MSASEDKYVWVAFNPGDEGVSLVKIFETDPPADWPDRIENGGKWDVQQVRVHSSVENVIAHGVLSPELYREVFGGGEK